MVLQRESSLMYRFTQSFSFYTILLESQFTLSNLPEYMPNGVLLECGAVTSRARLSI